VISIQTLARLAALAPLAGTAIASGCSGRHLAANPVSGCYVGPDQEKLELSSDGRIIFKGSAVGTYDVAAAKAKSGYMIAANGLTLSRSFNSVLAKPGAGEFQWPADHEKVEVTFGPSSSTTFRKLSPGRC
jgi:hypothetical protein